MIDILHTTRDTETLLSEVRNMITSPEMLALDESDAIQETSSTLQDAVQTLSQIGQNSLAFGMQSAIIDGIVTEGKNIDDDLIDSVEGLTAVYGRIGTIHEKPTDGA